jgi:hypothetical protein
MVAASAGSHTGQWSRGDQPSGKQTPSLAALFLGLGLGGFTRGLCGVVPGLFRAARGAFVDALAELLASLATSDAEALANGVPGTSRAVVDGDTDNHLVGHYASPPRFKMATCCSRNASSFTNSDRVYDPG